MSLKYDAVRVVTGNPNATRQRGVLRYGVLSWSKLHLADAVSLHASCDCIGAVMIPLDHVLSTRGLNCLPITRADQIPAQNRSRPLTPWVATDSSLLIANPVESHSAHIPLFRSNTQRTTCRCVHIHRDRTTGLTLPFLDIEVERISRVLSDTLN